MQTIDLGTISIGGESISADDSAQKASVAGEIVREDAAEALFPQAETVETTESTCCEERREELVEERPDHHHDHGDDIRFERCEDYKHCHLDDAPISGQGRILDLSLRLKSVCPGKRVAVGVMLHELDEHGHEYPRGMKTFTVRAHRHGRCTDIPVETVRFILPEDVGVGTAGDSCGNRRRFVARVSAHYIDFSSVGASL